MYRRSTAAALGLLALFALPILPASAQNPASGAAGGASRTQSPASDPSDQGSLPSPSRLRVASKPGSVSLTWIDAAGFQGKYGVFRDTKMIDASGFGSAKKIGEVDSGTQAFTDSGLESGRYFYLVLALAANGQPYRVFGPGRNLTTAAIALEAKAPAPAAAAPSPAPPPLPKSQPPALAQLVVDGIGGKVKGDAVVISYHPSTPKMRLVLYRGVSAISEASDLLEAAVVAAFEDKDGSFADYPVPGVDYWYAILPEDDLKAGRVELRPGRNATSEPIRINAPRPAAGIVDAPPPPRTPPLPSFLLDRSPEAATAALPRAGTPPPAKPLSPETEKAVAGLLANSPPAVPPKPPFKLLKEELNPPSGGEDYALSLIVSGKLAQGEWAGGAEQLKKYLSLNRSAHAVARARFYLGQALANVGSLREAFFEFISARPEYAVETRPWIDFLLASLRNG